MTKRGFTLLELLLAIVLLATVVAVCVPYLRGYRNDNDLTEQSRFFVQASQAVKLRSVSTHGSLTIDDQRALATEQGWVCEPVESMTLQRKRESLEGEWVLIRSGHAMSVHWVAPLDREEGP